MLLFSIIFWLLFNLNQHFVFSFDGFEKKIEIFFFWYWKLYSPRTFFFPGYLWGRNTWEVFLQIERSITTLTIKLVIIMGSYQDVRLLHLGVAKFLLFIFIIVFIIYSLRTVQFSSCKFLNYKKLSYLQDLDRHSISIKESRQNRDGKTCLDMSVFIPYWSYWRR